MGREVHGGSSKREVAGGLGDEGNGLKECANSRGSEPTSVEMDAGGKPDSAANKGGI